MFNSQPQITFVYDRRRTATSTRKAAVEMRVSYNYKQKYLSTGIMLYPNQWKKGKIINCPDIVEISKTLNQMLINVRQIIIDMGENIDLSSIPNKLRQLAEKEMTFIQFCIQRASIRKYGKEKDTKDRYDRFIRLFQEWGEIKTFEDIKDKAIIDYDKYLTSKGMKPYSKWQNYHRFLNSFIIDAIEEGLMQRNPYKWINIQKGKESMSIHKCLSPEEFTKIKYTKMPTESLERVRDVFVFQTYTCMAYCDMERLDARKIQEVKGMKVYLGTRKKTYKDFTIPILSPAWDILMKYEGKLPIISNVKYNEYLKVVAQSAGVDKPISSHWARHTGATLLLNEGIDIKIVAKICGHSSTRITEQIYAKLLNETVVDAVSKVDI